MIPGNIDLTENLDFRKTVRKELPQLPDIWKDDILAEKVVNRLYISNDFINFNTWTTTTFSYDINDYDTWNLIDHDGYIDLYDNMATLQMWNNDSTTPYTINYNISDNIISYSSYTPYTSTSRAKIMKIDICYEDEYDIFGNKKVNRTEQIPKIPWDYNHDKYHEFVATIPWRNNKYSCYAEWLEDTTPIPWDDDRDWTRSRQYDLTDIHRRAKQLVSWLSDKSNSFIDKYFEDSDEVDLSYLTNMSWIHVKDAVID